MRDIRNHNMASGAVARKEVCMLWTVFIVLVVLWLRGFSFHVAGGLIHLLLIIAVISLVLNLLRGRRSSV